MAHYALLDENSIVVSVIAGIDESEDSDWEQHYGEFHNMVCKRTSYNTYGGVHCMGGSPFRKNYAGIGFFYDSVRDAFIPPKPYPSWVLNEDSCLWKAPIDMPDDGVDYDWDEDSQSWVAL